MQSYEASLVKKRGGQFNNLKLVNYNSDIRTGEAFFIYPHGVALSQQIVGQRMQYFKPTVYTEL